MAAKKNKTSGRIIDDALCHVLARLKKIAIQKWQYKPAVQVHYLVADFNGEKITIVKEMGFVKSMHLCIANSKHGKFEYTAKESIATLTSDKNFENDPLTKFYAEITKKIKSLKK